MAKKESSSFTLSTGSQTNTFADTALLDGTRHILNDSAGTFSGYYEFQVPAASLPQDVVMKGYLTGTNDTMTVAAYNWSGAAFETIGTLTGQAGTANITYTYDLLDRYIGGAGSNVGKIRVRFSGTGLTTATLAIDQIIVDYEAGNVSIYEGGFVWVDTVNGTAGTTADVNGTILNPVDSLADALTIAADRNIRRIAVLPGSALTAASAVENYIIQGRQYSVALGGQSFAGTELIGADDGVSGTYTGSLEMIECQIDGVTGTDMRAERCGVTDSVNTFSGGGTWVWHLCFSEVAGSGTPIVDCNTQASARFSNRAYSGGVELRNMTTGTVGSLEFIGGQVVINANCSDGALVISGNATLTDNASGAVDVSDDARVVRSEVVDEVWDELQSAHTTMGSFGAIASEIADILTDTGTTLPATLSAIEADTQDIQSRLPASLNNGAIPADVQRINDVEVTGNGTSGNEWGPA